MSSTRSSGIAKNVASFEELISQCKGFEKAYNPSRSSLTLQSLSNQLAIAIALVQTVNEAKSIYDKAVNARASLFKTLKPLATRIVGAIASSGAPENSIADFRSINLKIQGRRAKAIVRPAVTSPNETAIPKKTHSVSQQSFDSMVAHFSTLIVALAYEKNYMPNEEELKVASLAAMLADLRAKNTAVIYAYNDLWHKRIARNQVIYGDMNGVIDLAQDVKQYVKSVFGANSPEYKQVVVIPFKKSKDW